MWRSYHSSQTGEGGLNYGFYNNPQFDRLIEDGRATLDPARRCDIYRRAQRTLVNDFVGAWVMQQHTTIFVRSRVKNYKPLPNAFEAYSFYEMYKEGR
jgi:peptide/nickel transport system substrate-binding protein